MAVTRPLKEGSVTTYQQKVALGFPDILASEMDADLDTIYAAWNGNVGTANLVDGSVTYAKLAPDAQLWRDTGTALVPGTNFATRPITVTGGSNPVIFGTRTAKGHLIANPSNDTLGWTANAMLNAAGTAWTQDDATRPSWFITADLGQDTLKILRIPTGSTTPASLLTVDSSGYTHVNGIATGAVLYIGENSPARAALSNYIPTAGNSALDLITNLSQFNTTRPVWILRLDTNSDVAMFMRQAPSGGAFTNALVIDAAWNMTLAGTTAVKASGTTWSNPSDRRLKDDIEDYATGLAAILQLQPRTFVYNGNGGSPAGLRGYGFIADEIAPVMPETVGVRAGKLAATDEDETDIQTLDQSNLILALVNAVKELATRMTAVEAR